MRGRAPTLAWGVALMCFAIAASSLGLSRLNGGSMEATGFALPFLSFPLVGAIVAARRPKNPLGWMLLAVPSAIFLYAVLEQYATYALVTRPGSLPFGAFASWVRASLWAPGATVLIVFTPLLFPTGRPLTARWRAVGIAAAVACSALVVFTQVGTWGLRGPILLGSEEDWGGSFGAVTQVAFLFVLACGVAAWFSLILRYRRAAGEERAQLKWFTFAIGAFVLGFMGVSGLPGVAGDVAQSALVAAIPAAIGISILKYRLYDIDVVISRTLVFGGLAVFITAIYVGIVVGVGSLLGAGNEPNLALSIVATAVVAVAFQPVRERLTRLANRLVFGKRATPYEVLSRFSSHLGETVATEDTLERMARLLADGTGAGHAQVSLSIAGQMVPVASVGEVDASVDAHTVDVTHQSETLGALSVTKKRGEALTPADVKLVDDLAAQAGLLLRNVRLTEELKAKIVDLRGSRQRLVAAQDAERRRLERDLHDGAQQQIVALKLKLGIARTLAKQEDAPETVALVDQLAGETDETVQTLRELAHGIYPPLLAAEGLPAALTTQARRAAVPVTVHADGIGRYDPDVEAAVYFCVLEAVNNAAKYADPSQVTITLADTDGQLTFTVTDDGTGFDPATTPRGHGLTNMTDRLDALGGHVDIGSSPNSGTAITGLLPAAPSEVTV